MADTRPQPIPGVTMDSGQLDFWYSMPADEQAKILAAPDRAVFPQVITDLEYIGVHTWAEWQTKKSSDLGPFDFYGVPGLQQGAQVVNGAAGAVTSTADFLAKLSDPHMWVRILLVGIGAALVVTALGMVAKPAAGPVASAAKKVV